MQRLMSVLFSVLLMIATSTLVQAQPTEQPGDGELFQIGSATLDMSASQIILDDLARKGRVRGIRLKATGGGVIIAKVVVRYANGQVHYENREIVLGDGEQTKLIDPRFEERPVASVEVVLKAARRSSVVTLEVWAPQSAAALAEVRPKAAKKRSITTTRQVGPPGNQPQRVERSEPSVVSVEPYAGVAVFYGTDRNDEAERTMSDGRKLLSFGGEPESMRRLVLGRAVVTIPKVRKVGTIPRPEIELIIRRVTTGAEDRSRHFTLLSVESMDQDTFGAALKGHLVDAKSYSGQAFVFVHGFNVSFDDALFRAAQITHDMGFDGLPLVYSWPSAGRTEAYELDRNRAVDSADNLVNFLNLVADKSGARDIHLVAHSTGAFVLMQALKALQRDTSAVATPKLGQVVFAAPDILSDSFASDAQRLKGMGKGMTLYASSGDWALWVSGLLKTGRNPAGTITSGGIPVLVAGVDSIDVSKLDTSYFALNHSGFGDHETLIKDIGKLIASGARPPNSRDAKFKERSDPKSGGKFWRYEAR